MRDVRPPLRILCACLAAALAGVAAPRALAASNCGLAAQPAGVLLGLSTPDPARSLQATGDLRAVMLFVDFPDAPGSADPRDLYGRLVPDAARWFDEASYGRLRLSVDPVEHWYRMPRPATGYGFTRDGALTLAQQRDYVQDAVAAADRDVDFSRYQLVLVVAAPGSAIAYSPAYVAPSNDWGVRADGAVLRYGVTFGQDAWSRPGWGAAILDHELGHVFGLPDLYDVHGIGSSYWDGLRFAGGWDLMSWLGTDAGLTAWERWQLGWLDDAQVECVAAGTAVERTLTPLEEPGGQKALVFPTGPSSAYVVEVRQRLREDAGLCAGGVLVYRIDTSVDSGDGPLVVRPAQPDVPGAPELASCGPLWRAAFGVGGGEVSSFRDDAAGFSLTVVANAAGGGYVVRAGAAGAAVPAVRRLQHAALWL